MNCDELVDDFNWRLPETSPLFPKAIIYKGLQNSTRMVYVVNKAPYHTYSMAYSRWVMCKKLNRVLSHNEKVIKIDKNPLNDRCENLRLRIDRLPNGEGIFSNCTVYESVRMHKGFLRTFVSFRNYYPENPRKTIYITKARYIMCIRERRMLESWEEVDHIDNDRMNDDPSNLQILSSKENQFKDKLLSNGRVVVHSPCPMCGAIIEIDGSDYENNRLLRNPIPFCSQSCGNRFRALYGKDASPINLREYTADVNDSSFLLPNLQPWFSYHWPSWDYREMTHYHEFAVPTMNIPFDPAEPYGYGEDSEYTLQKLRFDPVNDRSWKW